MSEPRDEDAPRVVIRDKRRIDPTSGTVRVPAGDQPAGTTPGPRAGGGGGPPPRPPPPPPPVPAPTQLPETQLPETQGHERNR
jgi:molecular chaperone GrpE